VVDTTTQGQQIADTSRRPAGPWWKAHLLRVTSSGSYIPEIDGLRFVAIMSVVLFHIDMVASESWGTHFPTLSQDLAHRVCAQGYIGVQLFFIISGFILSLPFAAHHLEGAPAPVLWRYYLRRVTRLEPPYILNLLLLFALLLLQPGRHFSELLPHLLASMGYVHNIAYGVASSINYVAWSLEVEVQFYLLAPFLTLLFMIKDPRLRRGLFVAIALAAILIANTSPALHTRLSLSILGQVQYFLMGFLLSDIYLIVWRRAPRPEWRWDVLALGAWLLLIPTLVPMAPFTVLNTYAVFLLPFLMLVAYMGAFRGVWANRVFTHPVFVVVGGMCYTIYLYHELFMYGVGHLSFSLILPAPYWVNLGIQALLIVPVILLGSTLLFMLCERPFMQRDWPTRFAAWSRNIRPRRKKAEQVATAVIADELPQ
jgi:peptidoglycan/LPS O-acetylase OafA/YrhL